MNGWHKYNSKKGFCYSLQTCKQEIIIFIAEYKKKKFHGYGFLIINRIISALFGTGFMDPP